MSHIAHQFRGLHQNTTLTKTIISPASWFQIKLRSSKIIIIVFKQHLSQQKAHGPLRSPEKPVQMTISLSLLGEKHALSHFLKFDWSLFVNLESPPSKDALCLNWLLLAQ